MKRGLRRIFSPSVLLATGAVLVVAFAVLWIVPSNEYIFLPDQAHPVAPLVNLAHSRASPTAAASTTST